MPNPDTIDALLEEDRKASEEIRRLKEAQRIQIVSSPEMETANLESAITYWSERKLEIESKMRLLR